MGINADGKIPVAGHTGIAGPGYYGGIDGRGSGLRRLGSLRQPVQL